MKSEDQEEFIITQQRHLRLTADARRTQGLLYWHFREGKKPKQSLERDFQGLLDLIRKKKEKEKENYL